MLYEVITHHGRNARWRKVVPRAGGGGRYRRPGHCRRAGLNALSALRLEMGTQLGLRNPNVFSPLWVVDFPLLEWDEATQRFYAMHHPFTSPRIEDVALLDTDPGKVRANAYDLVINGVEIGGGSIRIFHDDLQQKMFKILGFTEEEAEAQRNNFV